MFDRPLGMSLEGSVLTLSGSVDEYSVSALRERLAELLDTVDDLVVDLSDVDFLPSAGIGILVRSAVSFRKRGGSLEMRAAQGTTAHSTLSVAGLAVSDGLSPGERPGSASR